MIPSALEWVDAFQEANRATGPKEKEAAAARLVAAELRHYERLGLERRPGNPFFRTVLPSLLVTMVAVTLVLVVIFSARASNTASDVQGLQMENIISQRENCERGNDARVGRIHNLKSDVLTLQTQLTLWTAVLAKTPAKQLEEQAGDPVFLAFNKNLRALEKGVRRKRHAIASEKAAIADVAVKGEPAFVDCALAYPSHS